MAPNREKIQSCIWNAIENRSQHTDQQFSRIRSNDFCVRLLFALITVSTYARMLLPNADGDLLRPCPSFQLAKAWLPKLSASFSTDRWCAIYRHWYARKQSSWQNIFLLVICFEALAIVLADDCSFCSLISGCWFFCESAIRCSLPLRFLFAKMALACLQEVWVVRMPHLCNGADSGFDKPDLQ